MARSTKDILYACAEDELGVLQEASKATKDHEYRCADCGQSMVLVRGAGVRRPHFRHKVDTTTCSPETVIHLIAKNTLFERLRVKMDEGAEVSMEWNCHSCDERHSVDLLEKVSRVELEPSLGSVRPDLLLYGVDGSPTTALEIVVTHAPEEQAVTYYKKHRISVIQFAVRSAEDVDGLRHGTLKPEQVSYCIYPRCPECGDYMVPLRIRIVETSCWRCKKKMRIAVVFMQYSCFGPEEFTPAMIELARRHGVNIEHRYSKTIHDRYWANTCPHCNSIVGRSYMHDFYYDTPLAVVHAGYGCDCNSYMLSCVIE